MRDACGEQKYVTVPRRSVTVTDFVPLNATPVIALLVEPLSLKSCAFDLSVTRIVYLPALSVRTRVEPFFSVIVKPGPTVPVNRVASLAVEPVEGMTSATAAASATIVSQIRDMSLLAGRRRRPVRTPDARYRISTVPTLA